MADDQTDTWSCSPPAPPDRGDFHDLLALLSIDPRRRPRVAGVHLRWSGRIREQGEQRRTGLNGAMVVRQATPDPRLRLRSHSPHWTSRHVRAVRRARSARGRPLVFIWAGQPGYGTRADCGDRPRIGGSGGHDGGQDAPVRPARTPARCRRSARHRAWPRREGHDHRPLPCIRRQGQTQRRWVGHLRYSSSGPLEGQTYRVSTACNGRSRRLEEGPGARQQSRATRRPQSATLPRCR
jgi:hypothetical protein